MNRRVTTWLPWAWCVDGFFYALAFPIVACVVNRRLDVLHYTVPSLVMSACGGLVCLLVTGKSSMRRLYDRWFGWITALDMTVWIWYFSLWIAGVVPDRWYPIACSVMHVSTVELSRAVRTEFETRLFPSSDDRAEFGNACGIVMRVYGALGSVLLMAMCVKSMEFGLVAMMVAMVVDNVVFLWLWRRFETGRLVV